MTHGFNFVGSIKKSRCPFHLQLYAAVIFHIAAIYISSSRTLSSSHGRAFQDAASVCTPCIPHDSVSSLPEIPRYVDVTTNHHRSALLFSQVSAKYNRLDYMYNSCVREVGIPFSTHYIPNE